MCLSLSFVRTKLFKVEKLRFSRFLLKFSFSISVFPLSSYTCTPSGERTKISPHNSLDYSFRYFGIGIIG